MKADPAELIFFREMNTDLFFEEAKKQGVPVEQLDDTNVHNRLFHSCLVQVRARTAKAVAEELEISITEDQAISIARNSLVPDVSAEPAPLTPQEREIAGELYYHAILAATSRHGMQVKEKMARAGAKRMIARGERGQTFFQRVGHSVGCLVVLGMVTFGTMLLVCSALAVAQPF